MFRGTPRSTCTASDATHLATAVQAGADRFLTNHRNDHRQPVDEIDVVYPDELDPPG